MSPVWIAFDREELWQDIQEYKAKNSQLGRFRSFFHKRFLSYLRNEYVTKSGWDELKQYLELVKEKDTDLVV